MLLYILLIVFSILITLIGLGFLIGGLVKKNQKVWISGLAVFVVFTLITVVSVYSYVKAAMQYMATEQFQEETRLQAENMGKTWGNTVSGAAQGLEATLDDDAIAKLATKSAKIVGKGVKAIATGLDETTGKTTIFSDESIEKQGITIGRAEEITDSAKYSFGVFIMFKNDFDGTLVLTSYDSEGLPQDVSELQIKEKAGKSKVYVFPFDYFRPGMSGYCILTKG